MDPRVRYFDVFGQALSAAKGGGRMIDRLCSGPLTSVVAKAMFASMSCHKLVQARSDVCPNNLDTKAYIAAELLYGFMPEQVRNGDPGSDGKISVENLIKLFLEGIEVGFGEKFPKSFAAIAIGGAPASPETLRELTLEEFNTYLEKLAMTDDFSANVKKSLRRSVFIGVAAFVKQGNSTESWLESRLTSVIEELGGPIDLGEDDIKKFWNRFASRIDKNDFPWKTFFEVVGNQVGSSSVRLQTMLAQAVNAGFSSATIVSTAIASHPIFPWEKVCTSGEIAAARAAVDIILKDPYAGFKTHDTVTHRRLYPNALYCAIKLLVEHDGQASLNRFAGPLKAKHAVTRINICNAALTGYKEAKAKEEEEYAHAASIPAGNWQKF